jgi:tetratricopeptide (TPR) repeat protein
LSWCNSYNELFPSGAIPLNATAPKQDEAAMRALMIYVLGQDHGPPDSLYLGVRACRRALLSDPEDAITNWLLARLYMRLADQSRERPSRTLAPRMGEIRRTQMIAALHNCLRGQANPALTADAHLTLYSLLRPLGYLDMQAMHLREALQIRRTYGAPLGVTAEQFNQALKSHSEELAKVESQVKLRLDEYEVAAASRPPLGRIQVALEKGLADTAWNELKQLDAEEIKSTAGQIIKLQMVKVFLDLGWLYEASELLIPDPEQAASQPVTPEYLDLRLRLAAARGDYAEADRLLADALNYAWPGGNLGNQRFMLLRIGRVLLVEATRMAGVPRTPWIPNEPRTMLPLGTLDEAPGQSPSDFWVRRWRFETLSTGVLNQQRRSEWYLLRGWLALEAGQCAQARDHFQKALEELVPEERWVPEARKLDATIEFTGRAFGEQQTLENMLMQQRFLRSYAQYYVQWLDRLHR